MLRIVLPTGISSAVSPANVAAVAAAANWLIGRAVTTNIRVTVEIVVVVDVDVVVPPTTAPTPAAAPKCPHHHAHAK